MTRSPAASFVDLETALMNRSRAASKCPVPPPVLRSPETNIEMCAPSFERPYTPSRGALGEIEAYQMGDRVILQNQ